jgi:methylmalonyl-CoA decarboxylase
MALLLTDCLEQIGTITLNNPERRNCLSNALLTEMVEALAEFERRRVRAVVIRAAGGSKVWSAGFNVRELPDPGREPLSYSDPLERALRAVERFPAPVIAMIEGSVWGGACDLVVTCDLAIGAPSASFAITPAKLGLPYNFSGILHFLNVVGMRVAREMFFTAQPIGAERALRIGILNHLAPSDELESFTYSMARQIAENSPLAITVIKEQLRILGISNPMGPEAFERIEGLRREAYASSDYREGKAAFLEKRKPRFRGE